MIWDSESSIGGNLEFSDQDVARFDQEFLAFESMSGQQQEETMARVASSAKEQQANEQIRSVYLSGHPPFQQQAAEYPHLGHHPFENQPFGPPQLAPAFQSQLETPQVILPMTFGQIQQLAAQQMGAQEQQWQQQTQANQHTMNSAEPVAHGPQIEYIDPKMLIKS